MGFIMKIKIKNLPTYFDDFNSWCVDDNAKKKNACMYVAYMDILTVFIVYLYNYVFYVKNFIILIYMKCLLTLQYYKD